MFALIAFVSARMTAFSRPHTTFVALDVVMTSQVVICDIENMAEVFASMSAFHSHFAYFFATAFWNLVEVFSFLNIGYIIMIFTF